MSAKGTKKKKAGSSWRGIRQSARQVKVSRFAKQRYLKLVCRTVAVAVLLAALGGAAWGAFRLIEEGSKKITSIIPSSPVEIIEVVTDGVIPEEWVLNRIDLPDEIPLMEVDIHAIKNDIERHRQVRRAVVSRRLPNKLQIQMEERMPMMRLAARDTEGRRANLLVAEDGMVYQGVGYNRSFLASLPYISGVQLRREGGGFRRLEGMEPVAELLGLARSEAPDTYSSWKEVSCRDLPLIRIRSDEISEIVFRNEDFSEQLKRLQSLVLYQRREMSGIHYDRVDLSLGRDADVPVSAH